MDSDHRAPFDLHNLNRDTSPSNSPVFKMESPQITSPRVRAHSVAASEFFTIMVRGTPFQLTRSMILTDSPNWFTAALLGDFTEAESGMISTDRSPVLFALIVEYLCGYDILPLDAACCPAGMSLEATKRNLQRDAHFFGLDGLAALLAPPAPPPQPPRILPFIDTGRDSWNGASPKLYGPVELRTVSAEQRRADMAWSAQGLLAKPVSNDPRENRMVAFVCRDVQMIIELRPWANSVQWSYNFLHSPDWGKVQSLVEGESVNIAKTGGCSCVGLSRHLRFHINGVDATPDTLLLWSATRIRREGQDHLATHSRHELLDQLDSVLIIPFKRFGTEEAVRLSVICDRLVVALCQGQNAPYLAPLDVRGKTAARWWADFDETMILNNTTTNDNAPSNVENNDVQTSTAGAMNP